jgi:hypothetical protein
VQRAVLTERVIDEEKGDNSVAGRRVRVVLRRLGVYGRRGGDGRVRETHAGGGRKPERAATGAINDERAAVSRDDVPELQDTVDEVLLPGRGNPNAGEREVEVVRDDAVSGPLRKERVGDDRELVVRERDILPDEDMIHTMRRRLPGVAKRSL